MENQIKQLNEYIQTLKGYIQTNANNTGGIAEKIEELEYDIERLKKIEIAINNNSTNGSDGVTTADNGLTKTANNIQLGGPLIKDTLINSLNVNEGVAFQTQTDGTVNEFGTLMHHQYTNINKQAQMGFGNPGFGDSWSVLFADLAFTELVNFFIGDQSGMGGDAWQVNLGYNDLAGGAQAALNMSKGTTPGEQYTVRLRSANGSTVSNELDLREDRIRAGYNFEDATSIITSRMILESEEAELRATYEDVATGNQTYAYFEATPRGASGGTKPQACMYVRDQGAGTNNELRLLEDALEVDNLEDVQDPNNAIVLAYEGQRVRKTDKLVANLLDGIKSTGTGDINLVVGAAADTLKEFTNSPSIKLIDDGSDITPRIQYTTQSVDMNGYNIGSSNEHITKWDTATTGLTHTWNLPPSPYEGQEVIIKLMCTNTLNIVGVGGSGGTMIDKQDTSITPYVLDGTSGNYPAITLVWNGAGTNQWMVISERL